MQKSFYLDICSDDSLGSAQVKTGQIVDRCGNYAPSIISWNSNPFTVQKEQQPFLFVTKEGFSVSDPDNNQPMIVTNDRTDQIAQETINKLSQIIFSPGDWIVMVIKTSQTPFPKYMRERSEVLCSSLPINPLVAYQFPLDCIIGSGGGTNKGTLYVRSISNIHYHEPPFLKLNFEYRPGKTEPYVIAFQSYADIVNKRNIISAEIHSRYGSWQGRKEIFLDTADLYRKFPMRLNFFGEAQFTGYSFLGSMKRMGIYPYAKIKEFCKMYL